MNVDDIQMIMAKVGFRGVVVEEVRRDEIRGSLPMMAVRALGFHEPDIGGNPCNSLSYSLFSSVSHTFRD